VEDSKVSHQLQEESDVSHVIQEIRVLELLRHLVANCLHIHSCTVAILADQTVLDHLALDAFEILKLVADDPSMKQLNQSPFNLSLVQWIVALGAIPVAFDVLRRIF